MMNPVPTLADTLDKIEGDVPCSVCGHLRHPIELRDVRDDPRFDYDFICGHCYEDKRRSWTVAMEAELADIQRIANPWETPLAEEVRARRNLLISTNMWTVTPGVSPLTEKAQTAWMSYFKLLNSLTVDYNTPEAVVWPEPPTITAGDYRD